MGDEGPYRFLSMREFIAFATTALFCVGLVVGICTFGLVKDTTNPVSAVAFAVALVYSALALKRMWTNRQCYIARMYGSAESRAPDNASIILFRRRNFIAGSIGAQLGAVLIGVGGGLALDDCPETCEFLNDFG